MKRKRVYISGRMSGVDPAESQAKFKEAESYLRKRGFEPVNPWTLAQFRSFIGWGRHLIADLDALHDCDSIYLLPGWEQSQGANIEWLFAQGVGIPEYPLMRYGNEKS